jgi:hypothetical protein
MKRTELERLRAARLTDDLKRAPAPARFGKGSSEALDRRERRRRDQAQGLVPFAVKLNGELVNRLHARAQARGEGLNEVVTELLQKGLAASGE